MLHGSPPLSPQCKLEFQIWHCWNGKGVALLTLTAVLCLFSLALAQSANQQKGTRRVTALLIGHAAEGSRVTVIADSTLDDYEAFRRGDRFYVKIPSAEFSATQPGFHADGFDDVQVQKVGDSVVISFKLQPGASARVDGSANRLEVTFFSPNRIASVNNANTNAVRSRVTRKTSGMSATRSTPKRGAEVAGPMPPDSPRENSSLNVQDALHPTTSLREHRLTFVLLIEANWRQPERLQLTVPLRVVHRVRLQILMRRAHSIPPLTPLLPVARPLRSKQISQPRAAWVGGAERKPCGNGLI